MGGVPVISGTRRCWPSSGADVLGDCPVISGAVGQRPSSGAEMVGEGTGKMEKGWVERGVNAGAAGGNCCEGRPLVPMFAILRSKNVVGLPCSFASSHLCLPSSSADNSFVSSSFAGNPIIIFLFCSANFLLSASKFRLASPVSSCFWTGARGFGVVGYGDADGVKVAAGREVCWYDVVEN